MAFYLELLYGEAERTHHNFTFGGSYLGWFSRLRGSGICAGKLRHGRRPWVIEADRSRYGIWLGSPWSRHWSWVRRYGRIDRHLWYSHDVYHLGPDLSKFFLPPPFSFLNGKILKRLKITVGKNGTSQTSESHHSPSPGRYAGCGEQAGRA